jgi:long-chain acyl-CoA synthetase
MRHGIYQILKQKSELGYNIFRFATTISMAYKESSMYLRRRITNKRIYSPLTSIMSFFTVIALFPLHKLFSATVYKKLKAAAGLDFRASISGGGALSMQDEYFYDAIGVNLRVGYGLTETSPVLTLRNVTQKNFLGCVGQAVEGTELKIVDPHTFKELKKFQKGLVLARGPQIMQGYYKDPEATKAIIDQEGWLNTGDLGWLTNEKNLVLVGRLKETIVLSTGENVEPVPIEEACLNSPYIEQIVLVGQDKSGVGALVIPSQDALEKCGLSMADMQRQKESSIENRTLRELIKRELNTCIKNKPKLRPFERIIKFELLKETFSMDNGLLTQSAKVKRNNVFEKYKDLIVKMYK